MIQWIDRSLTPPPDSLPPAGWQDALDTWLRIWRGACRELDRRPYSTPALLTERTAYRRLTELMAQRPTETP